MTGAFFGSPSEGFRGAAQVGVAVQVGWTTAAAGLEIGFDAPGGLGEWPGSFRARGAVVSQQVYLDVPKYREPFGCGATAASIGLAANRAAWLNDEPASRKLPADAP
jgi:hypothetical protein